METTFYDEHNEISFLNKIYIKTFHSYNLKMHQNFVINKIHLYQEVFFFVVSYIKKNKVVNRWNLNLLYKTVNRHPIHSKGNRRIKISNH